MSNHLATYLSLDVGPGHDQLLVTAFNAGKDHPEFGVQFTLASGGYCALDGAQVAHLIHILTQRLLVMPGFGSTDHDRSEVVETTRRLPP